MSKPHWRDSMISAARDGEVAGRIASAIELLLRDDATLLERDVNERAITARFAEHMRHQFPGWDVDAEYNRDGHEVKRANGHIVIPDVIVHHRGTRDNLVVIEVKKSNSAVAADEDLGKLHAIRDSHLAYRHALFVKFIVGVADPHSNGCEALPNSA